MAAKPKPLTPALSPSDGTREIRLTFNGEPISAADAFEKLKEIYGEKRAREIPGQLANGTHGCASVAGGYLELEKPQPPAAES